MTVNPFYKLVITSFALVNNLLLGKITNLVVPRNLWAVQNNQQINKDFISAGLIEVGDLSLVDGTIDLLQVMALLPACRGLAFMVCAALQRIFASCLVMFQLMPFCLPLRLNCAWFLIVSQI